jgi:hypothetical protein
MIAFIAHAIPDCKIICLSKRIGQLPYDNKLAGGSDFFDVIQFRRRANRGVALRGIPACTVSMARPAKKEIPGRASQNRGNHCFAVSTMPGATASNRVHFHLFGIRFRAALRMALPWQSIPGIHSRSRGVVVKCPLMDGVAPLIVCRLLSASGHFWMRRPIWR